MMEDFTEEDINEFIKVLGELLDMDDSELLEHMGQISDPIDKYFDLEPQSNSPNPFHKPTSADIDLLKHRAKECLEKGCQECGSNTIVFQAAISIEKESKVFLLMIECPQCKAEYTEILAILPLENKDDEIDDRSLYK